jgi:hypothetical protein
MRDPPPRPGHELLREAVDAAKAHDHDQTDARIAREVFNASGASLSEWCSGKTRPAALHRDIAWEWARVPKESWYTHEELALVTRARELGTSLRAKKAA